MSLTAQQIVTLRADIAANSDLAAQPKTNAGAAAVTALYNTAASPAFYAWDTAITRAKIYHQTSAEATTWDWNVYKAQSVPEQNAWVQMFMGDTANMALPNLRTGVEKIFGVNNAQTVHVKAASKRPTTRIEKLFSSGTGSLASPAVMTFEGAVTPDDIQIAMEI